MVHGWPPCTCIFRHTVTQASQQQRNHCSGAAAHLQLIGPSFCQAWGLVCFLTQTRISHTHSTVISAQLSHAQVSDLHISILAPLYAVVNLCQHIANALFI